MKQGTAGRGGPLPPQSQLSAETRQKIELLKQQVGKLKPLTDKGDPDAIAQYNVLREPIYKAYTTFNTKQVNPAAENIKKIQEQIKAEKEILVKYIDNTKIKSQAIADKLAQLEQQAIRYNRNPTLAQEIDILITQTKSQQTEMEKDSINKQKEIQDNITSIQQELKNATELQRKLKSQKTEMEAVLKIIPELKKPKTADPIAGEIKKEEEPPLPSFEELINSNLLTGIWLHNLKQFVGIENDAKAIDKYKSLTNPEVRKAPMALLSMKNVLAIASGYVTRPSGAKYNDLDAMLGAVTDDSKLPFLQILMQDCYEMNATFKAAVDKKLVSSEKTAHVDIASQVEVFTQGFVGDVRKEIKSPPSETSINNPPQKVTGKRHSAEDKEESIITPKKHKTQTEPQTPSDKKTTQPLPPPPKRSLAQLDEHTRQKDEEAKRSMKEEGYTARVTSPKKEKVKSSPAIKISSSASDQIIQEMELAKKQLQMLSTLAENFDEEIPESLSSEQYAQLFDGRVKFIETSIAAEREMLKKERESFSETKEALVDLSSLVDEIKPGSEVQQRTPTEQIQLATTVIGELKQEAEQKTTPENILQRKGLGGLGEAYSLYKRTHNGQAPSLQDMNRWGDAAGLRKNFTAWKSALMNADKSCAEYEASTSKKKI